MQHNRHQGRGVRGPVRVWRAPEEGRERGVVNFDAGMGEAACTEGGVTSEIGRKRFWSKAKRGGGGRDAIFNHGIDLQLRIMERLGDMTGMALSENLRIPLAADGREIFLRFISKGYCVRSCTRSHAPVQGHNHESVIRYIRVARETMNQYQK